MTASTSFENEHIKLNVEKKPDCKVIFSITTLPLATKAAKQAAIRSISKEVNIPGFRKGKAPEALVQKQFSGQIDKEFMSILTRNSLHEAMNLSGIHPFRNESPLKLLKCDPVNDSSYELSLEFESYPDIPRIDPGQFSIADEAPEEVTEQQVEAHIDELKLRHAAWTEVTDRPAEKDDFVTVNIDLVDSDGEKPVHQNSRFPLKEGPLPKWLYRVINGLTIGSSATGHSEAEEPTENFQSKTFKVTLTKIERPVLPPLDEALAKKAGVESVELLKEAIKKSLEKDARLKALQKMRFAIKKELLDTILFEIPGERVKQAHQECHEIAAAEKSISSQEEQEAYARELFDKAHASIRFSFLLSKILYDNQLKFPTVEEIRQRAIEDMLMRYMKGDNTVSENDMERQMQTAENELAAEKALDFLIENCKKS